MKVVTTNLLNRFWQSGIKPIKETLTGKVDSSKIVNSLLTTEAGFALDARQGKVLDDKVTELNGNKSNILSVETFVSGEETIESGHVFNYTIDINPDGYEPIGILGIYSSSTNVYISRFRLLNSKAYASLRNTTTTSLDITVTVYVLCVKK